MKTIKIKKLNIVQIIAVSVVVSTTALLFCDLFVIESQFMKILAYFYFMFGILTGFLMVSEHD